MFLMVQIHTQFSVNVVSFGPEEKNISAKMSVCINLEIHVSS